MTSPSFARDERVAVARALHDGVAQTLAALVFELASTARDCSHAPTVARLTTALGLARDALEQARAVSLAVLPPPHGEPPHGDPLRALLAGEGR